MPSTSGYECGELTATQLVDWYLERIQTHNNLGPKIQAVVTVNPEARDEAVAADEFFASTGEFLGPLHGVPVLVKDQAETAGLRTTFGSALFESYVPESDATLITNLKEAGAIILAKTTMCDFAMGWFSSSSLTGHTKNPYDLTRDSGGSSAGTAAGVAANFGLVGIGEDTGGSIRIPASFNNLFGLRVTTGLISRSGFSPLRPFPGHPRSDRPDRLRRGESSRLHSWLRREGPLHGHRLVQPASSGDTARHSLSMCPWQLANWCARVGVRRRRPSRHRSGKPSGSIGDRPRRRTWRVHNTGTGN